MVEVKVCVGSSCHMKGSYQVIKTFGELSAAEGLSEQVVLKASFCMGHCLSGICCEIDGELVDGVGFVNAKEIFYRHVFPKAKGNEPE